MPDFRHNALLGGLDCPRVLQSRVDGDVPKNLAMKAEKSEACSMFSTSGQTMEEQVGHCSVGQCSPWGDNFTSTVSLKLSLKLADGHSRESESVGSNSYVYSESLQ